MKLILRHNVYHLRKRVPARYGSVEDRQTVWISLRTDSESEAQRKAGAAWDEMLEAWEARLDGDTSNAEARFEAAKRIAQRKGFKYMPAFEVAGPPPEEIVSRVRASRDRTGRVNLVDARALLGAAQRPDITVTRALDLYWGMTRDKIAGKSPDQLRRWRNPRIKAVKNFVKVIGDIPISEITRDNMLDFCDWWMDRLETKNLTPNSANKDLVHISGVLKLVDAKKRLGIVFPFGGLSFKEGEKRTRPPFSIDWLKEKLLAPGALDGLNLEARCILLGMVNTGYRPSEGACLGADQIHLDADIPHISIEPVGRTLKSQYSRRLIPLTGVSLAAFRECPDGFPRYADNPTLSSTINKFLTENGLRETPEHSLYSLRHSFEDRLLDQDVDERIRRDLMGHTLNRERYGKGPSLEKLHGILERIAL